MIIYLHGFRSGPESWKAQSLKARLTALGRADAFWCGQLPASAHAAVALAEARIADCLATSPALPPTLVGSSLGGYYATHLAEKHGLPAVLINPAVIAPLSLAPYLGTQTHLYTGEAFEFTEAHVEELRAIEAPAITRPERYWLLVEEGDEVLDYRHALARYQGARQTVLPGGDHSFTQWDAYLDPILRFAGILP